MRLRDRYLKFWYGRNGADQLYQFTMWLCLGLMMIWFFWSSILIPMAVMGLMIWATYRSLSKNLYRRKRENQAFLDFFKGIKKWFQLIKNKWRDRKTHVYRKCPKCRNYLRLPKIKGKHTVCCPCCTHRFPVDV